MGNLNEDSQRKWKKCKKREKRFTVKTCGEDNTKDKGRKNT